MKRNYESSIFDHIKVKGKYVLKKRRNWVCVWRLYLHISLEKMIGVIIG